MSLIDKIVKHKRMQRLSGSLAMIIPENWIRNMEWTKVTPFAMEFRPFTKQIIITEECKKYSAVNELTVQEVAEEISENFEKEVDSKIINELENGKEISEPILV